MTNAERHTSRFSIASVKTAAIVIATVLVAAPTLAQRHAQPRSGGGGGGSSSGHSSGGRSGGHSSGPSVSHGGGSSSSGGHRVPGSGGSAPHRPTGSGRFDDGHGHGHGHGGGYYYSPYYYSPYYRFSFGFGYGGYPYAYSPYAYNPYYYGYYRPYGYYAPYYGYQGYGYPPRAYGYEGDAYDRASLGAVALKVRPKTAEVYIDGRYVGAAGSYDGFPGYLWLEPGSYRLEVVQDGYANLEREIEITSGQVLEFKLELEHGVASRPEPSSDRYDARGGQRAPYPEGGGYRPPPPRGDQQRGSEQDYDRGGDPARDERRDLAEIVLDVRPDDASVYLDGRFVGTGRQVSTATEPLVIEPGEHRLQVIHPDFTNEDRTVTVTAGEEKLVEVTLRRSGDV